MVIVARTAAAAAEGAATGCRVQSEHHQQATKTQPTWRPRTTEETVPFRIIAIPRTSLSRAQLAIWRLLAQVFGAQLQKAPTQQHFLP
jgi:hypothetical protein